VTGARPRWPNLFLVGAAKAGTTSVYEALARHPAIYMSPVKEPHYFSRIEPSAERRPFFPHVRDEAAYLALFDGAADDAILGEASTSYLWEKRTAARIKEVAPEATILIMLRDPVKRAYSQYWNDVREGLERRAFLDALREERQAGPRAWGVNSLYIDCGMYADQVERYLDAFDDRVHVSFFEDFVRDPAGVIADIHSFLGLERADADAGSTRMNPTAMPRNRLGRALLGSGRVRTISRAVLPRGTRARLRRTLLKRATPPPMDPVARALLVEAFGPQVPRLSELLDRPLPWGPRWRTPQRTANTEC
jgi:hypothetical protein